MADEREPRHRGLFWTAVAVCLALVVTGGVMAFVAYESTSGPGGAVKGYFAALSRSDAPAALAFGTVPDGPHTLLTRTVLREQQRLAPIREVEVLATERNGNRATVTVQYRLEFADGAQQAVDAVRVVKKGRSWRLARTAVATRLHVNEAANRATILGGGVPADRVLMFPGAVPISFDSPYLALSPATSSVRLSDPIDTQLDVEVTPAGREAVKKAMTAELRTCYSGAASAHPLCPLPSQQYVPGSIRGTVRTSSLTNISTRLDDDPDGVIVITVKDFTVRGTYQKLDFNNIARAGTGVLKIRVAATAYAVPPLVVTWGGGV